jgi:hypothetical protein
MVRLMEPSNRIDRWLALTLGVWSHHGVRDVTEAFGASSSSPNTVQLVVSKYVERDHVTGVGSWGSRE